VHDVEAARAELEIERLGVDDDLVPGLDLADEARIRPRRALAAVDLDPERIGASHDAPAQLQHQGADPATIASHTACISTIPSAATDSCAVWLASVPFASRTASNPEAMNACASLPPPVAISLTSCPRLSSPAFATPSPTDRFVSR